MKVKFVFKDYETTGYLGGDILRFFYNDIGLDFLQGFLQMYDWDSVVTEFKDRLDIKVCKSEQIPQKLEKNCIRFTVSPNKKSDNNSIPAAFFRHLRNAFSHYSITENNSYLFIEDHNGKNFTMRGIVHEELLKQFCFKFFEQRDKIEKAINNY